MWLSYSAAAVAAGVRDLGSTSARDYVLHGVYHRKIGEKINRTIFSRAI